MSKSTATKNYIYNLTYNILEIIIPLITTPYLSRVLGAETIGIYNYTISIVTYFILIGSLGIDMYVKREMAYVQGDKEKRSYVFWELFILKALSLGLSLLIFYFTFACEGEYKIYYRILMLEIFANMLDVAPFFKGMEEFKKVINRNLIIKAISIFSIFIFVKKPEDIGVYLFIYVISTLIGNLSLWPYVPQYIEKINIKRLKFKRHLKTIIELFIPQIAVNIYTVLDKTMIGSLIADKGEVGYYVQSQKIIKTALIVITSFGAVMLPRIASKFAQGKSVKENILDSINYVYFLSIPMIFGLVAIAQDLIPWFLGDGFEKSLDITYVLSPIILFIGMGTIIGYQFLLPTQKQRYYTIAVASGAISNIIFNFILIPKFLSIGAAISTVIAEFIVVILQLYFIRKDFNMRHIIKMSGKYFLAASIMFLIIIALNEMILIRTTGLIRMCIDIISGSLIYVLILMILKDQFIKKVINKVLKIKIVEK